MIGRDLDNRANGQLRVKCGDIGRFHSNTTVAGWPADRFLLWRSMNINAPVISVRVYCLQPAQPDDAGNDGIATWRVWLQNFTGEPAVMKNRAGRSVITDFLSNLESAKRRCHRAPSIAESEFGGGDWVDCGIGAVVEEHQFLIAHANDHVWLDQLGAQWRSPGRNRRN